MNRPTNPPTDHGSCETQTAPVGRRPTSPPDQSPGGIQSCSVGWGPQTTPEILAAYEAARQMLAEHAVTVTDPRVITPIPTDPTEILGTNPIAYSVEARAERNGINLCRHGRFGLGVEWLFVKYPAPPTDPEFAARLAEVLVPAAEVLLAKALGASEVDRITLTPDTPPGEVPER